MKSFFKFLTVLVFSFVFQSELVLAQTKIALNYPPAKSAKKLVTQKLASEFNLKSYKHQSQPDQQSTSQKIQIQNQGLTSTVNQMQKPEPQKGLNSLVINSLGSKPSQKVDSQKKAAQNFESKSLPKQKRLDVQSGEFPQKTNFVSLDKKSSNQNAITQIDGYEDMLFGLGLVALFLLIFAFIIKKIQNKNFSLLKRNQKINLISQQNIDAKSKILLVEVEGKKFLIGATPENIRLIADLEFFGDDNANETEAIAKNQKNFEDAAPLIPDLSQENMSDEESFEQELHAQEIEESADDFQSLDNMVSVNISDKAKNLQKKNLDQKSTTEKGVRAKDRLQQKLKSLKKI